MFGHVTWAAFWQQHNRRGLCVRLKDKVVVILTSLHYPRSDLSLPVSLDVYTEFALTSAELTFHWS